MNKPYVIDGKNQITKENPFINHFENRKTRRKKQKTKNNSKGFRTIITKLGALNFIRYNLRFQKINNKLITHFEQV